MWARYSSRKNRRVLNTGFDAAVSEAAQARLGDHPGEALESSQVVAVRFAVADSLEQAVQLHGADAARNALAAGLVAGRSP